MSVRGWSPGKEVNEPRGMWSATAQKREGNPERASYCENVRFSPGVVRTRPGTYVVVCTTPVTGKFVKGLDIANLGSGGWLYFYLLGSQIRSGALNSGTISCPAPFDYLSPILPDFPGLNLFNDVITPLTPYTINCAFFNNFAFIALSDKGGNGLAPCLIADNTGVVDVAFSGYTRYRSGLEFGGSFGMTFTSLGAGNCTAGQAQYAIVLQTGTGFLTLPIVETSPSFPTDSKIQATVTIPANTTIYGSATVYLIKTRTDNQSAWYWIPNDPNSGTIGELPFVNTGATPHDLNFIINISDEDMAASLDSANAQWLMMMQNRFPTLTGPIKPSFVVLYGKRMCYGDGVNLYVSDINNPQSVSFDQHLVQTPKQLKLGYAFPLPGSTDLYMTGAKWLGRVTDNNDVPATWPPPVLVSDTIGSPFPGCVCYRTAGNYVWLTTDSGIYVFDGTLGRKPVTYLIQDQWKRVNWNAAYCIEMEDDIVNRILYVAVPLDNATEVNAVFCIDYTYGLNFDQVDASLDLYPNNAIYSLALGPDVTGVNHLWLGTSRGDLLQLNEATTTDAGGPISSIWESGLVRSAGDFASRMIRVGGLDVWARGGGGLFTTVFGPDKQRMVNPILLSAAGVPAALSPAPGLMYQHKFDFSKIENYTVKFSATTWFELSGFTAYSRPDLYNR